ncbi:hypothetical protein HPB50_001589 [Hyalomma asiaticum]|uniref:Uncharacterized protein n=1 Tax=Hyalomma asiaticum TaxID=266040 RepID=A0ACB7SJ44_HYAAI|nr:hypothetical protein HPB50_001589 [Hyalomma asiaticum]
MDKAAERRARRAAAARARRSDPAVRVREAEASRDTARRRREDPAVRALTLLTSFIESRLREPSGRGPRVSGCLVLRLGTGRSDTVRDSGRRSFSCSHVASGEGPQQS